MHTCVGFLLLAATLGACTGQAHAQPCDQGLPPAIARRLLYDEPNRLLEELGKASDEESVLTRTFLSPGHIKAASLLQSWMRLAGMTTWQDDVANVHGRVAGTEAGAKEIVTGSHYDTVVDGGKYDGALGIIVGIAAVKARLVQVALCKGYLTEEQLAALDPSALLDLPALLGDKTQQLLPEPVHVIGFSDEEGVRFQSTFLGSRAVAGELGSVLSMRDAQGVSIAEALEQQGLKTGEEAAAAMKLPADKVKAYVEVHIEQGPVLEQTQQPIGVVTGIAGQTRLFASLVGEQGHAGTVPMSMRKDPMAAAGSVIAKLEELCSPEDEENKKSNLVCTVGAIYVYPNAGNVIPRYANFTIDIRSQYDDNRLKIVRQLREFFESTCDRRGLGCALELKNEAASIHSDPDLTKALSSAAQAALASFPSIRQGAVEAGDQSCASASPSSNPLSGSGGRIKAAAGSEGKLDAASGGTCSNPATGAAEGGAAKEGAAAPQLVSGAGHDAMIMAKLTKMAMLFVRCRGGISHSADEYASPDDIAMATTTFYSFLGQ